ncbi:MAG TPA: alpha/beta hydrolase-fold protein [Solirubrobacteraceae bacterium]
MRRRRLLAAVIFVFVALGAFVSGAAVVVASRVEHRAVRRVRPPVVTYTRAAAYSQSVSCPAPSLDGALPAMVYLPSGYRGGNARYPVIYFLHGLPATRSAYQTNGFVAASVPGGRQGAIVVAPQGARTDGADREYLDWDAKEDWPQALTTELTHCIDLRYRTYARRSGRALVGLSAGGYGAFNVGLRALKTFGVLESWSGYFVATDPSGNHVLDLGSPEANDAARAPDDAALASALKYYPSLLAFYIGNQDSRFLAMNRQYDAALTASGISHVFRVYPGGHSIALWQTEAAGWLRMALQALAAERARSSPTSVGAP